jgi:UDP-N-acetylglucosamine--N-acetylmuramyl-(pentapeptide) pyrophosphoryl-undecaprenol N-acetylglucosamine transferase
VFVSFEYSKKFFPKEKVVKTGLPVRRALIDGLKLSKGTGKGVVKPF